MLPANLDGSTPPPGYGPHPPGRAAGSLARARRHRSSGCDGSPTPRIHFYYFHPDFTTPENSCSRARSTSTSIRTISCRSSPARRSRLREVRSRPTAGSSTASRTATSAITSRWSSSTTCSTTAAAWSPRWYEVRDPFGSPTVFQQGTYAPDDGVARWMGSAAMDVNGNIAIGYSRGRRHVDQPRHPLGGPPGQRSSGRPDPSARPSWFPATSPSAGSVGATTARWRSIRSTSAPSGTRPMYTPASEGGDWSTRVGSFKFPTCSLGPTRHARRHRDRRDEPDRGRQGHGRRRQHQRPTPRVTTSFTLPVGTYDMTASKYGFLPGSANGIVVTDDGDTVQDFVAGGGPERHDQRRRQGRLGRRLAALRQGRHQGSGRSDVQHVHRPGDRLLQPDAGLGHPVHLHGHGGQQRLPAGRRLGAPGLRADDAHRDGGRTGASRRISSRATRRATPIRRAPSSRASRRARFRLGWTSEAPNGGGNWRFPATSSGDGCANSGPNNTGGSGGFAILDSDCDGLVQDDAYLNTPSVDLSGVPSPILQFNSDYIDLDSVADVDLSTDGGTTWIERLGACGRG